MSVKVEITHMSNYEFTHIIHLSDLHIRPIDRHTEYEQVFEKLYESLLNLKHQYMKCMIIITGDIFDNPNVFTPEQFIFCDKLFNNLLAIYPLIVIAGNHDMKDVRRLDSISPSAYTRNNFYYLSKSGAYEFGSVIFSVTSLYDDTYEFIKREQIDTEKLCIALYHGTLAGSSNDEGFIFKNDKTNSRFRKMSDFNGYNAALLGDIHKMQSLTPTMWYSGSLVQQNYGETLNNHGYLLWDLSDEIQVTFHEVINEYGRVTIIIENNEWKNPDITFPKKSYIRCQMSNTIESKRNEIIDIIRTTKQTEIIDVYIISNDKFLTNSINKTSNPSTNTKDVLLTELENYNDTKISDEQKLKLVELHKSYMSNIKLDNAYDESCLWHPLNLEFKNLFGYSGNYLNKINFAAGVTSITAPNASGKTSIINILFYTLFGDLLLNPGRSKNIDIINNKEKSGYVKLSILYGNNTYIIEKGIKRTTNKNLLEIKQKLTYQIDNEIIIKEQQQAHDKIREMFGNINDFYKCNVLNNRDQSNDFFRLSDGEKIKYLKQSFKMDYFDSLVRLNKDSLQQIEKSLLTKQTTLTNLINENKTLTNDDPNFIKLSKSNLIKLTRTQKLIDDKLIKYSEEYDTNYKELVLKENCIIDQNIDIKSIKIKLKRIMDKYKEFTIINDLNKLKTDLAIKNSMLNNNIKYSEDEIKLKLSKIIDTLSNTDINLDTLDINALSKLITQYETEIKHLNKEITDINNKLKLYNDYEDENIEITKNEIINKIENLQKQYNDKVPHKKQIIQTRIKKLKLSLSDHNTNEQLDKITLMKDVEIINNKINDLNEIMTNLVSTSDSCDYTYEDIEKLKTNIKPIFSVPNKKPVKMITHKKNLKLYEENQIKIDELLKVTVTNEIIDDYIKKLEEAITKEIYMKKDIREMKTNLLMPLKTTLLEMKECDESRTQLKELTDSQNILMETINGVNIMIKENGQIDKLNEDNNTIIKNNEKINLEIMNFEYHNNNKLLSELENVKEKIMLQISILDKMNELSEYELMLKKVVHNEMLDKEIGIYKDKLNILEVNELKVCLKEKENSLNIIIVELDDTNKKYEMKMLEEEKNILEKDLEATLKNNLLINEIKILDEQLIYEKSRQEYDKYMNYLDVDNKNKIYTEEIDELKSLIEEIKGNQKLKQREKHELSIKESKLKITVDRINNNTETILKLRKGIEEQELKKQLIDVYSYLISPKCLQPIIIKKELKKLELSMNDILSKYTKYSVEIIYDDKNGIDIITKTCDDEKLTIERLSTYETLILTTAFKRSISKHTNKTRSKLYIIDESVENLDKVNFEKVLPELMRLLMEEYSHILIISQRDIQHIRDNEVKIVKKNGVSVII